MSPRRIAAVIAGMQTLLSAGATSVLLLWVLTPQPGSTTTNAPQAALLWLGVLIVVLGIGSATTIGLWLLRGWASPLAVVAELAWVLVVFVGVNGPAYSLAEIIFLAAPGAIVICLVAVSALRS